MKKIMIYLMMFLVVVTLGCAANLTEIKAETIITETEVSIIKPLIKIISPNGGEKWVVGNTYNIKWETIDYSPNTAIQIGLRDVRYDPNIAEGEMTIVNTINTGSYNWTIPSTVKLISDGAGPTHKIIIYIAGGGPEKYDESDNYFSLDQNVIPKLDEMVFNNQANVLNVPFYEQMKDNWCGPTVIQSILEYYNISKLQTEIAVELGFLNETKKTLSILEMHNYFLKYGFKVEWYANQSDQWALETMDHYLKNGNPVIVLQRFDEFTKGGHYRIVIGKVEKEQDYFVYDVSLFPFGLDLITFKAEKSGYIIIDSDKFLDYPIDISKEEFLELWQANQEDIKENNIMIVPIPKNNF